MKKFNMISLNKINVRKALKTCKLEILVVLLFILSRLPALGHDNFNTDVWRWKARIYDFGSGVFTAKFDRTIQMYHPGVSLMWIGSAAVKSYNLYYKVILHTNPPNDEVKTIFELDYIQKLFIVSAIAFTISFAFYPMRKMFGAKYASIAVALISAEPFYIALTRVIHLEGLMSTFMLAAFVWFYFYLKDTSQKKRLVLSAIFTSLALLTKSSSLFLLPFMGLMLFLENISKSYKFDKLNIKTLLITIKTSVFTSLKQYYPWLLLVLLLFFILWPGMWVTPLTALQTYFTGIFTVGIEGGHEQLFFGKFVTDPGPFFYPIVLVYKTSFYFIFGLVGFLFISKKITREKNNFALYALLFSLLYLLEILISSKKLDRYVLPSIVGISLVNANFYEYLLTYLLQKFKKLAFVIFPLVFVPFALILVSIHPDYFSYYSILGGGLKTGIHILEPKWLFGVPEITDYFKNELAKGEYKPFTKDESLGEILYSPKKVGNKLTVAFPEKYYTQIWPFIREIGGWAVLESLGPEAQRSNFFVYPVWDDTSASKKSYKLYLVDSIKVQGVPVYNVYKRGSK